MIMVVNSSIWFYWRATLGEAGSLWQNSDKRRLYKVQYPGIPTLYYIGDRLPASIYKFTNQQPKPKLQIPKIELLKEKQNG